MVRSSLAGAPAQIWPVLMVVPAGRWGGAPQGPGGTAGQGSRSSAGPATAPTRSAPARCVRMDVAIPTRCIVAARATTTARPLLLFPARTPARAAGAEASAMEGPRKIRIARQPMGLRAALLANGPLRYGARAEVNRAAQLGLTLRLLRCGCSRETAFPCCRASAAPLLPLTLGRKARSRGVFLPFRRLKQALGTRDLASKSASRALGPRALRGTARRARHATGCRTVVDWQLPGPARRPPLLQLHMRARHREAALHAPAAVTNKLCFGENANRWPWI